MPNYSNPDLVDNLPYMDWFPKRFSLGEMDGEGAKKLLGRPDLHATEVLVRETAQNSWDARGQSAYIDFTLNLRVLCADRVRILREQVFANSPYPQELGTLLASSKFTALEVADTWTIGLRGPIRDDKQIPESSPTNFIDFVFNLGTPKQSKTEGGTYGFGKSISYLASEVGTVIIWSKSLEGNRIEDRLIASAIGAKFNMDNNRYTGRHWWGRLIPSENRVEPLVGTKARNLAQSIFAADFPSGSTGTRILILSPVLGTPGSALADQARFLARSVRKHLWPKLVVVSTSRPQMHIQVQSDGQNVPILDSAKDRLFNAYADCLIAVRNAQIDGFMEDNPFITVIPIRHGQYRITLGHLALTRVPTSKNKYTEDRHEGIQETSNEMPLTALETSRVALMRHDAELVVRYLPIPKPPVDGFECVGVFKPVSDLDSAFAASEPPAHDNWNPDSMADRREKSLVRVALKKIGDEARSYVTPNRDTSSGSSFSPAAVAADRLRDLVFGTEGSRPNHSAESRNSSSRKPRSARPFRAEIVSCISEPSDSSDWIRNVLTIRAESNRGEDVAVRVVLSIGSESGGESIQHLDREDSLPYWVVVRRAYWHGQTLDSQLDRRLIRSGETAFFTFESRKAVAVDVSLVVEGQLT